MNATASPSAIKALARERIRSWHAEQTRLGNPQRVDRYELRTQLGYARCDLDQAAKVPTPRDAMLRDLRKQMDAAFSTDPHQDRLIHAPERARLAALLDPANMASAAGALAVREHA